MDGARELFDINLNRSDIGFPNGSSKNDSVPWVGNDSVVVLYVIGLPILITCLLGAVGNGIVIWLLSFCVQRTPFMTYILNLAVADLGVLISTMLFCDPFKILPYTPFGLDVVTFFHLLTYSTSQFLLTAISIDRCVAFFFPLWYHCHRPPRLSSFVCALMWVLTFLLATISFTVYSIDKTVVNIYSYTPFIVNAGLCLPLMTISTLALFIKVCFKSRQRRRGKLLTILLLTLAFFLLFAFPFNDLLIFRVYHDIHRYFLHIALLLASLNSSVNPVIYFLVGRERKTRQRESLRMRLQTAFEEEEEEEEGYTVETPSGNLS